MKDYKIKKKLVVTFGVIIAMVLVMSVAAMVSLQVNKSKYDSFYTGPYRITNYAMDMRRGIQSYAKNVGYAIMEKDSAETQAYIESAQTDIESMKDGIVYLMNNFRGDQTLITQFSEALSSTKEARAKIAELAAVNKNDEAAEIYFNEVKPILVTAQQALVAISDAAQENAEADYNTVMTLVTVMIIGMVILILAVVCVTVLFANYIVKSLTKPIEELEAAADKMAVGDFDVEVTYESKDELGNLAVSMNKMTSVTKAVLEDTARGLNEIAKGNFNISPQVDYIGIYHNMEDSMKEIISQLSDTMSQISGSAEQVSTGSTQLAENAQALAEGATEQAGAVEELTATIADVTESAKENAENASESYQKADGFKAEAENSRKEMEELQSAMEKISETSKEIQNIIGEIEDIASQTNLLSLNASIEAARAGEAGKGFAVVADQIGKLASDSAQSAVNTRELILKTLEQIETGNNITEQTAQSIEKVIEGIGMLAENSRETRDTSASQAETMEQIEKGIEQISGVVQSNSAAAQESSATSEELSAQSEALQSQVDKFILLKMS